MNEAEILECHRTLLRVRERASEFCTKLLNTEFDSREYYKLCRTFTVPCPDADPDADNYEDEVRKELSRKVESFEAPISKVKQFFSLVASATGNPIAVTQHEKMYNAIRALLLSIRGPVPAWDDDVNIVYLLGQWEEGFSDDQIKGVFARICG